MHSVTTNSNPNANPNLCNSLVAKIYEKIEKTGAVSCKKACPRNITSDS